MTIIIMTRSIHYYQYLLVGIQVFLCVLVDPAHFDPIRSLCGTTDRHFNYSCVISSNLIFVF